MRFPKLRLGKTKRDANEPEIEPGLPQPDTFNDATAEDLTNEHKSKLPRNLHWIVIIAIALLIGAATFVTSSNKQAELTKVAKDTEKGSMTAEEANKKSGNAVEQITQAQNAQESAVKEAKEKAGASAPASEVKPANAAQPGAPAQGKATATSTSPTSMPVATQKVDGKLPPPPPAPDTPAPTPIGGTQYSPTAISELSAAQGTSGNDAVRQKSSPIIALQGIANAPATNSNIGNDTANLVSNVGGKIIEATTNNRAAVFANMQPGKAFPAQASMEDIKAQIEALRAQYGNPATLGATSPMLAAPSAKTQPTSNQSTAQPVQLAPSQAAGQSRYIEAVKYDGRLVIRQGKYIPAAFLSAINSDLAGDITAIVTENVYDSIEGSTLLIPKGSTLLASYGNNVVVGQERMLISFTRILLPNGDSIALDSMNGVDAIGQSGADADVNNHFFKQFGAGLIGAVVSWEVDRSAATNITINSPSSSTTDLTTSTGKVLKELTDRILDRYKNLKPTLTVEPGVKIRLYVGRDIALQPYQQ